MPQPDHSPLLHPRYWLSWLAVSLFWLIGQLPWNLLLTLGRALGRISYYLGGERRQVARINIDLCFPELTAKQREDLVRDTLISTGEAALEAAGSYCNRRIDLHRRTEISGIEHLESAQARGRGVLLIGMHLNTLDVASRVIGEMMPLSAVYRPVANPVVEHMVNRGRGGNIEHYIDRMALRQLLRVLKAGKVVWYAPDQNYGRRQAVFAPFFGVPTATITATSRIARMSRAALVPVSHFRLPGGRYRICFGPEIEGFPTGDDAEDAAIINRVIENEVRKAPEQYLWVHRRFKRQPNGKKPYRHS